MKKKPIYFSVAICLFALSLLFTYFTMYSNVHGLDLFLNRELKLGRELVDATVAPSTATSTFISTPASTETPLATPSPTTPATAAPPTATPEAFTDITLAFAGDFLIHDNILTAQYDSTTKTYDFNNVFADISAELAKADLTVASLEVPFGGTAAGAYAGYPHFNCPDALATAFVQNKLQLLFTAGVHAYDAGTAGMTRTLTVLRENNLLSTGTQADGDAPNYVIAEVKGIRIGFISYTAGDRRSDGKIHANGVVLTGEQEKCLNVFTYDELDTFYTQLQQELEAMKAEGAEVLVTGIRWGTDYTTSENAQQRAIAQKLCDLGVDIIVGNGPHVIQPFTTFTSELSGKHTICMYSLGNFLSNQRKELVNYDSGHTEDGILYTVNLRKQADGTILLGKVQYVPTWVSLTEDAEGKPIYKILPLSAETEGQEQVNSYKRTQDIVADGVIEYNNLVSNY